MHKFIIVAALAVKAANQGTKARAEIHPHRLRLQLPIGC
jgi:hypothetical protein